MPKGVRTIAILLCVLLLCTGCTAQETLADESRALSALRVCYRSAKLIATGVCTRMYYGENGAVLSEFRLSEVLAGRGEPGDVITCETEAMTLQASYLCYFTYDAANRAQAVSLAICPWDTDANEIQYEESTLSLTAVREDMALLQNVIIAPPDTWYYGNILQLMEACTEVFIGRVTQVPALADTEFREESGSATIEHTMPASIVPVTVYGSIKGTLRYGEAVSFVNVPAHAADMLDAATLTAVQADAASLPALREGAFCIFFLLRGPDAKQESYFCVNPLQGFIPLEEDILLVPQGNEAFSSCATLLDFLHAIQNV
ncbi:MAG: hypothetical protein Q4E65_02795 [Clostridia bacterium]|nr:hypothetical protein [Clostridia bacterium]